MTRFRNLNKVIIISLTLIMIIFLFVIISRRQEEKNIINILDNYVYINKIIFITDSTKTEITDSKELEYYKSNLEPKTIFKSKKNEINSMLGKKIIRIEFYVDNKLLFIEDIFLLKESFPEYFIINNQNCIALIDGLYRDIEVIDNNVLCYFLSKK